MTTDPSVDTTDDSGAADSVLVRHSSIRRRIADHMVSSLATSAHVAAAFEVDYEGVQRVRQSAKEAWSQEHGFGLTFLPFAARAAIDAIAEFPAVNATFTDEGLLVHSKVNLGIAVDLDFKGLIVPVVSDAGTKPLRTIACEINDLAARARAKKLGPDEVSGGTFTITNPGPFGTLFTTPIINQPQVAILSTEGVRRRPVAVSHPDGGEQIEIHSVGNIVLSWDHRAFDGAYAAAFLGRVRRTIEDRDWSSELMRDSRTASQSVI